MLLGEGGFIIGPLFFVGGRRFISQYGNTLDQHFVDAPPPHPPTSIKIVELVILYELTGFED